MRAIPTRWLGLVSGGSAVKDKMRFLLRALFNERGLFLTQLRAAATDSEEAQDLQFYEVCRIHQLADGASIDPRPLTIMGRMLALQVSLRMHLLELTGSDSLYLVDCPELDRIALDRDIFESGDDGPDINERVAEQELYHLIGEQLRLGSSRLRGIITPTRELSDLQRQCICALHRKGADGMKATELGLVGRSPNDKPNAAAANRGRRMRSVLVQQHNWPITEGQYRIVYDRVPSEILDDLDEQTALLMPE